MAEEDVSGGVVEEGDGGDGAGADEWVAPGFVVAVPQGDPETSEQAVDFVLAVTDGLTAEQEADIRETFGYSEPETRTKAERDEAARKMVSVPNVELPPDIESVWGEGRLDGLGCLAANTARALIDAWGIEKFRLSEIHVQAAAALRRDKSMEQQRAEAEPVLEHLRGTKSTFTPAARPPKPKSRGRSETCVHRIAPGNFCKFGCDE